MLEKEVKTPREFAGQDVYVKVAALKPNMRKVNALLKVVSKGQTKNITSRRDFSTHRVTEDLVGDETGCLILTLWNQKVDEFGEGDVFEIKNGYTTLYRGHLRLNIGKYGTAEKVEKEIGEINKGNNVSEKRHDTIWYSPNRKPFWRQRRRY